MANYLTEDEFNWAKNKGLIFKGMSGNTTYSAYKGWADAYEKNNSIGADPFTAGLIIKDPDSVRKQYAEENAKKVSAQQQAAARTSTEAAQSAAKNTQQAAQSTGIGGARAGVIANKQSAVNYGNQYLQNAPTMRGQASTAVADYLSKIGAARNAQQDANNAAAGAGLNMLGAILEGAGKGATTSAAIYSDERCKEPVEKPVADNDILDAVNKYFDLVKQVKQLKHEGKQSKELK
jgi:hypothetical protein